MVLHEAQRLNDEVDQLSNPKLKMIQYSNETNT